MDATSIEPELSEEGTSSGEESDLESCTIEVGGVNKSTSLETLRMFFESRRTSGGGKIDGDIGHTSNGNYIVTFKDREGKFSLWQNNLFFFLNIHVCTLAFNNIFTKTIFHHHPLWLGGGGSN